jgi:cytochrome oxidase assembly protein ShyY1
MIAVPVGVVICLLLSDWQWNRYEGRKEVNSIQQRNEGLPVVDVTEAMQVDGVVDNDNDWRTVTATGVYSAEDELLVRRKPLGGSMGFWVATPLVTSSGDILVVNRGWIAASAGATTSPTVPAPPTGQVTVTGRIQPGVPVAGPRPSDMPAGQISALDVTSVAAPLGGPVYPGYVELISSTPAQPAGLTLIPAPEVSQGSHLSYSMQWIVFAIMFIVGLGILIRREVTMRREEALLADSSTATQPDERPNLPQDSHL